MTPNNTVRVGTETADLQTQQSILELTLVTARAYDILQQELKWTKINT